MSVESAKDFLKRITTDDAFRKQVEAAPSDEKRKEIVKAAGYDFTADEIKSIAPKQAGDGQLSEEELAGVAGGSSAAWIAVSVAVVGAVIASA